MKIFIITTIVVLIIGALLVYYYQTRPVTIDSLPDDVKPSSSLSVSGGKKIIPIESQASFTMGELLDGQPVTVVGVTKELSGDLSFSAKPAKLDIGEIRLDARTFKTDSERRDGAIARMILKSTEPGNEYMYFRSAIVEGLPSSFEKGQPYSHRIKGDLVIRGNSRPVEWNATSTLMEDGSLSLKAGTEIVYGDFGLAVPDLPFLAKVDKNTKLSVSLILR